MNGAVRLKKGAFRAWFAQGSPEAADKYQLAQRAAACNGRQSKNLGKGDVWGGYGKGLLVTLKEVLANC